MNVPNLGSNVPTMGMNEVASKENRLLAGELKKQLKTMSKNELINMVLELGAVSAQIHEQNKFLNDQLKVLNEKVNKDANSSPASSPITA